VADKPEMIEQKFPVTAHAAQAQRPQERLERSDRGRDTLERSGLFEAVRVPVKETSKKRSFALLSPCGYGNLGDAAIQDAVIENIRRRFPDAAICGITLKPTDTRERHGIRAFPIAGTSRPFYPAAPIGDVLAPAHGAQPVRATRNWRRVCKSLASLPIRVARLLLPRGWPWMIKTEMIHIAKGFAFLRQVDLLVVSGGGQLDDDWGGAWGHPYALFKWSVLARLRGAKPIFLGVGFGALESRLGRLFTRAALRLAAYRSYRDAGSRERMNHAGFRRDDPIFPDLAYSFPLDRRHSSAKGRAGRVVGLCPFCYCHPDHWPKKDARTYDAYLQDLASIVAWLVSKRYGVSLFGSDRSDRQAIDDLWKLLPAALSVEELSLIERHDVTTVTGFLERASDVDLLIASRLHGVLLAQLTGTPVIALSYDRKVDVQMESVGHEGYCLPIAGLPMSELRAAFERLEASEQAARQQIDAHFSACRAQLEAQYDAVL
jgi:polysaccharide pyruvyl transferase WcaK-like protein